MVARSQIRQYPEPVLREPARAVSEFSDDLRALVERMITLMDDANGVGLAGNQVGLLRRVLVYRPDREDAEARALVNPVIVERSEETAVDEEGCLSLGPLRVPVERNVRISVDAQDENGEPVHVDAEDLEARILQHEIDHLDGVLTIDRTTARVAPRGAGRPAAAARPPALSDRAVAVRVAFAGTNWWAAEALERLAAAPGLEIARRDQPARPARGPRAQAGAAAGRPRGRGARAPARAARAARRGAAAARSATGSRRWPSSPTASSCRARCWICCRSSTCIPRRCRAGAAPLRSSAR